MKKKKASKLEVLEFIWKNEVIGYSDLVNRFNYSEGGAAKALWRFKQQDLVVNDRRGEWVLTDIGLRRLIYYGRLK
jgi:hypothetical protein